MTITKILFMILTILFLICICILLNIFNIRGKKIIRVKRKITIHWTIFFVLFTMILVFDLIQSSKYDYGYIRYIIDNIFNIYWIVFSLTNILVAKVSNTITEKGIYIDSAYYRWEKIQSYKWIDENTLEFRIKGIKKYKDKKLEVDLDVNRKEVDKILEGLIKENREYVS